MLIQIKYPSLSLCRIEAPPRESKRRLFHNHHHIISVDNLLESWREFLRGKRRRKDVQEFSVNLTENILNLHNDLKNKTYQHGGYTAFRINDPKPRDIHKASVRDRLLHHALYRTLYPLFDKKFIFDSYSCRKDKGTHRALNRFRLFARKVSQNHTQTAWVLKRDIRKFFTNIDHAILIKTLQKHITDPETVQVLKNVIESFCVNGKQGVGLPLGNLTSQLLINVYMNAFDHFVKRDLKAKYYIRYADDFVVIHRDRKYLEKILIQIASFLENELKLSLHPKKVSIQTVASGIDFLGWVHFPYHRIPRTTTKRRMFKRLVHNPKEGSFASYDGLLSHGNTYRLREGILRLLNTYIK